MGSSYKGATATVIPEKLLFSPLRRLARRSEFKNVTDYKIQFAARSSHCSFVSGILLTKSRDPSSRERILCTCVRGRKNWIAEISDPHRRSARLSSSTTFLRFPIVCVYVRTLTYGALKAPRRRNAP